MTKNGARQKEIQYKNDGKCLLSPAPLDSCNAQPARVHGRKLTE